jgi:iron complex outermembrane receptor protein
MATPIKKFILSIAIVAVYNYSFSQSVSDTAKLQEVVIKAYEHNRNIKDIGAAVSTVREAQFDRFGNASILSAVNSEPGIRMEERSPGSYRLNIRGSSLRAPFGVRNVKVYWNGIPFTDPGGNTYLNQFSPNNFSSVEILKGPGSSLYGAGTGGVMLANGFDPSQPTGLKLQYAGGSYAMNNVHAGITFGDERFKNNISYNYQNSNGYRDQSAMHRTTLSWETKSIVSPKYEMSTHVLYGDLFYQTPGGLTKAQYDANPKAARPASGGFPSAQAIDAAIYQKMFWAGFNQQYRFTDNFYNSTSVYGTVTNFKNSAIRNYEKRLEPHFGGRTVFGYNAKLQQTKLNIVAGAEAQQGYFTDNVYNNKKGNPDSLQTSDEINNSQWNAFAQAEAIFNGGWVATAGASINKTQINFTRTSVVPNFAYDSKFNNEWAPRFSLLKKFGKMSVYGVVSKGFSPPATQELLPATTIINTNLQAEHGWNYELGARGNLLQNKLVWDVNVFDFNLKNAIVQRRDASGADYYTNAGSTKQRGVEANVSYVITDNKNNFVTGATVWASYTYFNFHYNEFKQLDANYSGNQMPGIAPNTVAAGFDLSFKPHLYLHTTYFYSSSIYLNDANTDKANEYHLLGAKLGYKNRLGKHLTMDLFAGGDNLLNQQYSLGNDINATGGRYYNAAATANFYAGVAFGIK